MTDAHKISLFLPHDFPDQGMLAILFEKELMKQFFEVGREPEERFQVGQCERC